MIRKQLTFVKNNIQFIQKYLDAGIELTKQQENDFRIIQTIYAQQKYMYDNKMHSVPNRIVSFHQPFLRPIVRGKVSAPVEFDYKLDVSNSNGFLLKNSRWRGIKLSADVVIILQDAKRNL